MFLFQIQKAWGKSSRNFVKVVIPLPGETTALLFRFGP